MEDTLYRAMDKYINEYCKNEEIVIWGGGIQAKEFLDNSNLKINKIVYDNDENKKGRCLGKNNSYFIETGSEICHNVKKNMWILIISRYDEEISKQLIAFGYENLLSLRMIKKQIEIEQNIKNGEFEVCMLEATNFCNARCTFCINPRMKRKKMHMSQEVFEKIIERLKEESISPKIFRLHCSGEPLLDPGLFEKMKVLKEEFPESEVGYTTNFSVATDEIIEKILAVKQDYITISLNAVEAKEYRSIMGLDYDKTISNIKKLLLRKEEMNSNIKIVLSAVADADGTDLIEAFKELWENENLSVRIMKKGEWVDGEKGEKRAELKRNYNRNLCGFLHREICILSDGRYGVCCFDAEGNMGEMNIFNTGIIESFSEKKSWRTPFYLGQALPPDCKACSFFNDKKL